MLKDKKRTFWFSIIEVMVWVLIFSIGLVSIFMIIASYIKLNDYNRNEIIASNLARENIELFRNIRDSNYKKVLKWNQVNPWTNNFNNIFKTWTYYKLENDFSALANFPIKVEEITNFWEWKTELTWKMQDYKLCLDSKDRYTYSCITWNTKTYFYRYLKLDELKYMSWWVENIIENAYKIISKVIWYNRGYHEIEINSIVTDWRRL